MTVDYVQQMLEIQRGILSKAEATKAMWQDEVSNRYYREYIEIYEKYINDYIQGKDIRGKGLEDLLAFFEEKSAEMSQLTGCPNPVSEGIGCEGSVEVHDQYLNRNMDGFDDSVPNPDYLDDEKVQNIEEMRNENDRRNYMESPFQSFYK